MKLEILKNGRPRGWAISAVTLTFLAGVIVWGGIDSEAADQFVKMENLLILLVAAGCTGTTLNIKGFLDVWSKRKGAA